MKELQLLLFGLCLCCAVGAALLFESIVKPVGAFAAGAIRVSEVDGSPNTSLARWLKYPNGSLSSSGDTVTIGAGGAWQVTGIEGGTALLRLFADEDDDATDGWFFTATTSGTLTIGNDSGAAGTAVTKLTMTGTTGLLTFVGGLLGDGGDTIVGFKQNQITSTTTTLTIAQCDSTIVNDSADVLTLPEASTALGCRYTFVVANASNLDINPADGTDLILPFINAVATDPTLISPSAGDAIRCATVGGSITLEAVGNDAWAVVGGVAGHTWSDVN